ncbi:MAG: hypothetical protein KatS3mg103_1197 [Phycisphaerales bacterium]|nr:MAG: hypothetical protein KatS3mg103_1197 [Phycisphaerales bacterium]
MTTASATCRPWASRPWALRSDRLAGTLAAWAGVALGLVLGGASAWAGEGPRFVHEPYVPAPAVAGSAMGAASGAVPVASLGGGLAERIGSGGSAVQDDVEWSRRQREIALQEMWLYYRLGAGGYQRGSATFDSFDAMDFDADFDAGLLVAFAVGGRYRVYDAGPWSRVGIRVELEGLFGYTPYDRSARGGGPMAGDGDLFEYGLMVNVMPEVKLGRVSLFAGGGIGASLFSLSDSSPTDYDDSRGALALQLLAGLSVELAEPVSLYGLVRYRAFSNVHWYDDLDQRMRLLDLDGTALEVGLEFRF